MTVSNYFLPASVPEALGLLRDHGPALLVLAGGTVAMPLINEGISMPSLVMGLRRAGLDRIEPDGGLVDGGLTEGPAGGLRIGATVTLTRLIELDAVPLLREAASRTAAWAVRNMATLGGNLFTPPPGGDVAVALLALDARGVAAGPDGERVIPLADFWTGFMTNDLRPGELVTALLVPDAPGASAYLKFGRKAAITPSVVTVAVRVVRDGATVTDARVALGAAGPHPIRIRAAEEALTGSNLELAAIAEAAWAAARDCEPFTDGVANEWYRARMVELFTRRARERVARAAGEVN